MNLVITEQAQERVADILDFLIASGASLSTAHRILNDIVDRFDQLVLYPRSGNVEPHLIHLGQRHRYLVEGNYKIIYTIRGKTIYITDIFDTRQDPDKMKG